jgi:small subunit ribosomal protein S3
LGRKVHPLGFRLGIIKDWHTRWYAEGEQYATLLAEDRLIRKTIHKEMGQAGISYIEIERFPGAVQVMIHTSKPGIIIGRKGTNVNALRTNLQELTGKKVKVDVIEIEHPELEAQLVAEDLVEQLERRVSYKRAMKQAVARAMRAGAKGIMISCGGRLAGSEMARADTVREGQVPRHTLRADIDFARAEALTTYGRIGVKVWIYKGNIMPVRQETES